MVTHWGHQPRISSRKTKNNQTDQTHKVNQPASEGFIAFTFRVLPSDPSTNMISHDASMGLAMTGLHEMVDFWWFSYRKILYRSSHGSVMGHRIHNPHPTRLQHLSSHLQWFSAFEPQFWDVNWDHHWVNIMSTCICNVCVVWFMCPIMCYSRIDAL